MSCNFGTFFCTVPYTDLSFDSIRKLKQDVVISWQCHIVFSSILPRAAHLDPADAASGNNNASLLKNPCSMQFLSTFDTPSLSMIPVLYRSVLVLHTHILLIIPFNNTSKHLANAVPKQRISDIFSSMQSELSTVTLEFTYQSKMNILCKTNINPRDELSHSPMHL